MLQQISKRRFDALAGYSRSPRITAITDELAWFATPDERARLWPQVTTVHKGYAGYQEKTDREIPLVLLEPRR